MLKIIQGFKNAILTKFDIKKGNIKIGNSKSFGFFFTNSILLIPQLSQHEVFF